MPIMLLDFFTIKYKFTYDEMYGLKSFKLR